MYSVQTWNFRTRHGGAEDSSPLQSLPFLSSKEWSGLKALAPKKCSKIPTHVEVKENVVRVVLALFMGSVY